MELSLFNMKGWRVISHCRFSKAVVVVMNDIQKRKPFYYRRENDGWLDSAVKAYRSRLKEMNRRINGEYTPRQGGRAIMIVKVK